MGYVNERFNEALLVNGILPILDFNVYHTGYIPTTSKLDDCLTRMVGFDDTCGNKIRTTDGYPALHFNGTSSYCLMDKAYWAGEENVTQVMWFIPPAIGSEEPLFYETSEDPLDCGWYIKIRPDGKVELVATYINEDTNEYSLVTDNVVNPGQYNIIIVKNTLTTTSIELNRGTCVQMASNGIPNINSSLSYFGKYKDLYYSGCIVSNLIFHSEFLQDKIEQLYIIGPDFNLVPCIYGDFRQFLSLDYKLDKTGGIFSKPPQSIKSFKNL